MWRRTKREEEVGEEKKDAGKGKARTRDGRVRCVSVVCGQDLSQISIE